MQLRMRADAGATPGQLLGVAFEYVRVPADAAQHVGGEQPADRTADDDRAGLAHASANCVIWSSSATSSADSIVSPARTFCSTCSGVIAPAMTLAVNGRASSQPNATSSMLWP